MSSPPFLGYVCTYRYLVNGQFIEIQIDQAGEDDNWDDRTWEFFDSEGTHLNGGEVWHVDDSSLPTYDEVYECIIKPNYEVIE
jgi:hypothetical protein